MDENESKSNFRHLFMKNSAHRPNKQTAKEKSHSYQRTETKKTIMVTYLSIRSAHLNALNTASPPPTELKV